MSVQTYKTTDQFIEELKSFDDAKMKQLSEVRSEAWSAAGLASRSAARSAVRSEAWYAVRSGAWYAVRSAAWYAVRSAAWYADLAVLVKDKITAEQFEILTSPWTSCGLSLFVETDTRSDGGVTK